MAPQWLAVSSFAVWQTSSSASDDALIGDGHANYVGFGPVSAAIVARVLPRKLASELLFTGDMWSAQKLEQHGFVNRVVPARQVMGVGGNMGRRSAGSDRWGRRQGKK